MEAEKARPVLFVRDKDKVATITAEGHKILENCVTDSVGQVYVLHESIPSDVAGSAMARLSRCSDDLRVILINEFRDSLPRWRVQRDPGKEKEFLQTVISDYGDDSVQQLATFNVIVERASSWLIKLLERARPGAAYLEQSTRYILYYTKVLLGFLEGGAPITGYRYHVPSELTGEIREQYVKTMDAMFENYRKVVEKLQEELISNSTVPEAERTGAWRRAIRCQACDAARAMLPVATTSTVGIHASAQTLDAIIMRLLGHELAEARSIGAAMLRELRKVAPVFFERTDLPERGGATTAYLRETRNNFRQTCEGLKGWNYFQTQTVRLTSYSPLDEKDAIFELPFECDMQMKCESEEQETEILDSYVGQRLNRRHRRGRMLEIPRYTFRMRTPWFIFRDLQRHRPVDALEWGMMKPNYDFEIPLLIKRFKLEELMEESIVLSHKLSDELKIQHGSLMAQYSTLFAHKLNWTWTMNFREAMHIVELRTQPAGDPVYRKACQEIHAAIAKVHPRLASKMVFLNCAEDPELNRLAAERAKEFKLRNMK